jgi:hypothetical protein
MSNPTAEVIQTSHGIVEQGMVQNSEKLADQANAFTHSVTRGSLDGTSSRNAVSPEAVNAIMEAKVKRDESYGGANTLFTGYYLEEGAKFVIPLLTPLRNMTPRELLPGIDVVNWRAITDYFGGSGPSVAAGVVDQAGTPPTVTYNWVNLSNTCKMIGVKDVVTFEAEIYGKMFQGDVLATASAKLIPALMQMEEIWLINSGQKLWAPPPPAQVSTATTGGTVAAATNWIIVTAVNANGETLAYGGSTPTAISQVTSGSTSTVTFNIYTVPSAVSYNVYIGTGSTQPANSAMWKQSAATQFGSASALNQPTGVKQGYFSVTLSAAIATSGTAYSTIVTAGNTAIVAKSTNSANLNAPLTFDGIQALIYNNFGAGGSLGVGGETPLVSQPAASNGSLALSDIDTLLENMYLNAHADPEYLLCSVKDHKKLSYLVAQGTNFRVTAPNAGNGMTDLVVGQRATKYINQTTGRLIDIVMLPYLTQGTIIAHSTSIPFPVSAIDKPPFRIAYNRDMWSQVYAPDQSHPTQTMVGAYTNECLINQFLGGTGILNGISLS